MRKLFWVVSVFLVVFTTNVWSDEPQISVLVNVETIRFDIGQFPAADFVRCHYFSLEPYSREGVAQLTQEAKLTGTGCFLDWPRDPDHDQTHTLADSGRTVDFRFYFYDSNGVAIAWVEKSFILPVAGVTPRISAVESTQYGPPGTFTLPQNYPNPFNPTTTIEYELDAPSQVRLVIFNFLGQEVEKVVNEFQTSGPHRIIWNASSYPNGTYYCRLEKDGGAKIIKMTLLK